MILLSGHATRGLRLVLPASAALLLLVSGIAAAAPAPTTDRAVANLQIPRIAAVSTPTATGTLVSTTFAVKNPTGTRKPVNIAAAYLIGGGRTFDLGEVRVPTTAAGEVVTVRSRVAAPAAAPAGTYVVRVCLAPRKKGRCGTSEPTVIIEPAQLVAAPGSLAFGDTPVGSTSALKTVTVTNRGHAHTGQVDLAVTGDGFSLSNQTCGPALAPGRSCQVGVAFSPVGADGATGALVVADRRGDSTSVPLTGTGTGAAALSISPENAEFPATRAGFTSGPTTFIVTNVGSATSGIPSASLGSGPTPFAITGSTCTVALAPSQSCSVTAVFAPTSAGAATGALTVSATPGGTATAGLTGTGLPPLAAAQLVLSQGSVAFGDEALGDTTDSVTLTLTNTGDVSAGVPTVALGGAAADQFTIVDNGCTAGVPPQDSCQIAVAFAPTVLGSSSAALSVSAAPGGSATSTLTGTGVTPADLSIDASSYDFGYRDSPTEKVFTITNDGTVGSGVPTVDVTGSTAFVVTTDTCTEALEGGESCTVGVTYTGSGTTEQTAELSVAATPGGTVTADLTGFPLALTIAPASHDFGDVLVSSASDTESFTLTNHRLTPALIDGEDVNGPFSLDASCLGVTIPGGDTCTFGVYFAPMSTGATTGYVVYTAGASSTRLDVSGTGQTPAALSIDASSYDFGYSDSPTEKVFTITNDGTITSGVPTVDLTGSTAFETTTDTCTTALAGGDTCTVGVTYTGSGTTEQAAELSVSATPGGTVTADVTGFPLALTIAPASHDFGDVLVGDTSDAESFTLTNHRLTPALIDGQTAIGPFSLDTSCFTVEIPAGGTCTFTVRFAPTSAGSASGYIVYYADTSSTRLDLSGTGQTPAALSISPGTVDFGAYSPGSSGTQEVTITNTGTLPSTTVVVSIGGTDTSEFFFESTDCPTTLDGGASCTATIGFSPLTFGDKTATLTVTGAPGGTASIVAMGAPAGVTLYESFYDYGSRATGSSTTHTFRVVNTTDSAKAIGSINSGGAPFPLDFGGDFTCILSVTDISPHRWCTISIAFRPGSAGPFSRTLEASGGGFSTTAPMIGTGVAARGVFGRSPAEAASGPLPRSIVLRDGEVVVRRN